jgi:DNA uptake protein ComE-like DNA-binding protein
MILNWEPVKSWFGFTRRERRSASILLAVIFIIIGFRYMVPEKNMEIEDWSTIYADTEIIHEFSDTDTPRRLREPDVTGKTCGDYGINVEDPAPKALFSSRTSRKTASELDLQQKPRLDINSCDSMTLVALPGIGPVLSARIIKFRNLLGGFARVEQLKEVYGLPEETYEMIKGRLFADASAIRRININSAGYIGLSRIHYLEKYEVTAILNYIKLEGRANNIDELIENKILTPEKAEKVEAYIDFR